MTRHDQLVGIGRGIVQRAPQSYFAVDVRADGPPGVGSLLSIGAVDPWERRFYIELCPTDKSGTEESRQFCEEHGLSRERLRHAGTDPLIAMQAFREWVVDCVDASLKKAAVLVAFPSWFGFGHINVAMFENNMFNPFGPNGHCLQSLAMQLQLGAAHPTYDWGKVSLQSLPPELLPEGPFPHHALEGALYQQELHYAMVGLLHERGRA